MKVLLLDIDGKLPNIALHKLAAWHESQGDEVIWNLPLYLNQVDRVYASTIFTRSREEVENLIGLRPDIQIGGTGTWGWFPGSPPRLPPEVEATKALINYGFTTRGCIRHCPFCMVPLVEGGMKAVGDIYDIWDGHSEKIVLYDNNILALPDHFAKIVDQVADNDLEVDFNQGLDIRLMTEREIGLLRRVRLTQVRFAFDSPAMAGVVEEKIRMVQEMGLCKQPFIYVLVGFNTTFEEDLERLNLLRRLDCRAYVMRYDTVRSERRYSELAQWVNMFWSFGKYEFEEFKRVCRT